MINTLIFGIMLNLFQISPVLIVLFFCVIIILIYLCFSSELINKKIVAGVIIALLILFIGLNIFLSLKNKPLEFSFRLTIFPVEADEHNFETTWLAVSFWETLNNNLLTEVQNRAVVITANYMFPMVNSDSLKNLQYIRRINNQLDGDYAFVGNLESNQPRQLLNYRLIDTRTDQTLVDKSVELIPEKIAELISKAEEEIFQALKFVPEIKRQHIRYVSAVGYRDYLIANELFAEKKYLAAIQSAKLSIAADSSIIQSYILTGKCWLMEALRQKEKGEPPVDYFQKSFQWLSRAIGKDSTNGEAFALLGEYYIYLERWSLAEEMLVKAMKLNPQYPRLYLSLSRIHPDRYKKMGFRNEEEIFKKAIFINPSYEDAYLMLSDYYLFENKRDAAIEVLDNYLEINPNSVPVLMALGKIYLVRNDIMKIIEIYNRVIELEPTNSAAYYNLGILYYNSEDYDNAEKFLQKAIQIDNHLNSHLYLAYLYELKGDYENAIKQLRLRIRYRKGLDDEFAEEARRRLYDLMHPDTSETKK